MPICQFCNKTLATKTSLQAHQKHTKRCLEIQYKTNAIQSINSQDCEGCQKKFITTREFQNHKARCYNLLKQHLEIKDKEITRLVKLQTQHKDEINKLKLQHEKEIADIYQKMNEDRIACIEEIAKQPRYKNTTKIDKFAYLSPEPLNLDSNHIEELVQRTFKESHFDKGLVGVAEWAKENLLVDEDDKRKICCPDVARRKCNYRRSDGSIGIDSDLGVLTYAVAPYIKKRSLEIYLEKIDRYNNDDRFSGLEKIKACEDCSKTLMLIQGLPEERTRFAKEITNWAAI